MKNIKNKASLRALSKQKLASLTTLDIHQKSMQISSLLYSILVSRKNPTLLGVYYPLRQGNISEVFWNLDSRLSALEISGRIKFAFLASDYNFYLSSWKDLKINSDFGIPMPLPVINFTQQVVPDVILVPGLGFGPLGERLGRGGGVYDRALVRCPNSQRWGVGFECQKLSSGEVSDFWQTHDINMNKITTECGALDLTSP